MTHNKFYYLPFILLLCLTQMAQAQAPAFPGAEGHGRYAQGGRAADGSTNVYHVTSLEDNKNIQGTLRWALSQTGPRTIVFDVGGYIDLTSDLSIPSNTTIAGQTAPSPGITLRYYTVKFSDAQEVIVRFIRFRRSQVKDINDGADATWGRHGRNIILDHCSFSWSIDEIASFYDNRDFTMQWCVLGEGLCHAGHDKGGHSYGGIWGGKNASFHHNMITNVQNRCPRLCGARFNWGGYDTEQYANSVLAERVDVRNNLYYNWGDGNGAYGGMGGLHNLVNNYYKAGPGTKNKTRVFQSSTNSSSDSNGALPDGLPGRYYINGNYVTAAASPANYDWSGFKQDNGTGVDATALTYVDAQGLYGTAGASVSIRLDAPVDPGTVTTHTAQNAYTQVMAYAGASLYRDAVDSRYMSDAAAGTTSYQMTETTYTENGVQKTVTEFTKGIVDKINDPDGEQLTDRPSFPVLESTSRPANFDTDGDGIPDEWESSHGLDPTVAGDALLYTLDTEHQWYNNLEVYLNSLVEDIMKAGNENATSSVDEYYPTIEESMGESTEAYLLTDGTHDSSQSSSGKWYFNNGFAISTSKGYATGKNSTIKYSRNEQFTIVIPDGMAVEKVTFNGYNNVGDNATDKSDGYIAELNGASYTTTDYVFPEDKSTVEHTIPLSTPKTGSLTFTPKGQQLCLCITLYIVNNAVNSSSVILREFAHSYTPEEQGPVKVTLQRPMGVGYWNTFCVPFNISETQIVDVFGPGTEIAEFSSVSSSSLRFTTVSSVTAGRPCLVKPTMGSSSYIFTNVSIQSVEPQTVTIDDFSLRGTYTTHVMLTDGSEKGLTTTNQLAIPAETTRVMRGLRAYFVTPVSDAVNILVSDPDIDGISTHSVVQQGQPPIFNLQGQRIVNPSKSGVYIQGNRKFIIK